ncbi:uncharacterized protein LOC117317121 [Pecten maximus]|uniref:uncharacterized protein LOC117317121 n=1 Tax=Pecten maximus TaxID=6579 RepID=UPI00145864E1|nr:uncharacterized protein LOC117317121 [Pecten maximus]
MPRGALSKFQNVFFHRVILLLVTGITLCLVLFLVRRRHVMKGIEQTNNERFNMKDIRIKPIEGLKEEDIFYPSTTFSWLPSTFTSPLVSWSTTTQPFTTEGTQIQSKRAQDDKSDKNGNEIEDSDVQNTLRGQLTKTISSSSNTQQGNKSPDSGVKSNEDGRKDKIPIISEASKSKNMVNEKIGSKDKVFANMQSKTKLKKAA